MTQFKTVPASTPVALAPRSAFGSDTRSTGQHGLSSRDDILGRVMVSIMDRVTRGARPRPDRHRQFVHDRATAATPLTTWVEPINLDKRSAIPLCLVRQLAKDLAPADIGDMLGQIVIADQAPDVQIFHDDHLVFANQSGRHLVDKVHPAITHLLVNLRYLQTGFLAVLRTFLLASHFPLGTRQLLLILAGVARVADLLAIRQRRRMRQANVDTDLLCDRRQRLNLDLTAETDVVAPTLRFTENDGARVHRHVLRPLHVDIAQLGNAQPVLRAVKAKPVAGIRRALFLVLRLKRRIRRAAFPEVHKATLQMPQRLLQRHAADVLQVRQVALLQPGQHIDRVDFGDALLALVPGIRAVGQKVIVDFPTTAERLCELLLLLVCRVEPELICALGYLLTYSMLFHKVLPYLRGRFPPPINGWGFTHKFARGLYNLPFFASL